MNETLIRSIGAAGALMAVVLLAAACGDDAEALTKEEFVAQANQICEATNAEVEPIFNAVWAEPDEEFDPDDEAAMAALLAQRFDEAITEAMPIFDDQLEQLRALHPPEEDEALLDDLLDDFEAAVDTFADTAAAAAEGDQVALAGMEEGGAVDAVLDDVNERARAYGLSVCGEE